jgi:HlyD family secretion protein
VVVTLDDRIPEVRPGFSGTAEITTATRAQAVSVLDPGVDRARNDLRDDKGNLVRQPPRPPRPRFQFGPPVAAPVSASSELLPGQKREEVEGVFVVRDGRAVFQPVKVGIAGERYFEVASGLSDGDRVVTGPFESVRNLFDGDLVQLNTPAPAAKQ